LAKRIMKYNPSFLSTQELVDIFVVRHTDLELIVRVIRENVTDANQHVLVFGPRGSGKTTLVLRTVAEIERDKELSKFWYPLIFAEESYEVISVGEFWLEALHHLAEQTGDAKWKRTYQELQGETDDQRLAERALGQLMDFADTQGKKILLIVENLNMLFSDLISEDEAWKIRHALINEPRLMLLATATTKFENPDDLETLRKRTAKISPATENRFLKFGNESHAMYELFKMHELRPLNDQECNTIWELITGRELPGQQIRPLRILTGGNPRLITIIAKFGARRSFRQLLDDLVDLVDDHTEYFKSQLESLPTTERKVYLALAGVWNTSTARDIAKAARLDVNKTSSLLSRLISRGFVVVEDQRKKTKWYMVAERMYNIYYLMRRRGKPADRIKAAVKFMVSMYDPMDAAKLITEEASGLLPELRRDHCLAYEEMIKEIFDPQLVKKIVTVTPKSFLESPYLSQSLRDSIALYNKKLDTQADFVSFVKEIEGLGEKFSQYIAVNNHMEALKTIDELISKLKNSTNEALQGLAIKAMLTKGAFFCIYERFEEAIQTFDEVIIEYKDHSEPPIIETVVMAMFFKGVNLGALKRIEEAIQVYDEVITVYKDRSEPQIIVAVAMAMFNNGVMLGVLNRIEEAIQVYDEVIVTYKDRSEPQIAELVAWAMFNRGVVLGVLNRMEEEIRAYNEMIAVYKGRSEPQIVKAVAMAMVNKGVRLEAFGKNDEAEKSFFEATVMVPDFPRASIGLINLRLKMPEKREGALLAAEEIINQKPEDPNLLNGISWVFFKHRNLEMLCKAEQWMQQAVSLSPDNATMHHTLACILSALGKGDEALDSTKRYVQDTALVEKSIEDAITLFVELAASGHTKEALAILANSPVEKHLEPLVVGLKLFIGEEVKTAVEILEVAKDVVKRIEDRQAKVGVR